ncbi:hypothetical protein K431DRAFT_74235 [Polychaeton citri CBS 116435]|uniref:Uncharacterized protein n=1 Tax=Polychaeton citri CBS 116435 TaxID=1314669 RepID=A0A9P4Q7W7_9PEZI|nr:hypothetical protein K431DRAFT_74235 [Polychaeton citri CBS 116435]
MWMVDPSMVGGKQSMPFLRPHSVTLPRQQSCWRKCDGCRGQRRVKAAGQAAARCFLEAGGEYGGGGAEVQTRPIGRNIVEGGGSRRRVVMIEYARVDGARDERIDEGGGRWWMMEDVAGARCGKGKKTWQRKVGKILGLALHTPTHGERG